MMSDMEQLLAIEDIKHLKALRILALDNKDWETYASLHAPDHVSDNDGETPKPDFKENVTRLANLLAEVVTVHHVHSPVITFTSPTIASGAWAMEDNLYWQQDGDNHWLKGYGFYYETYEKRDGNWLFTSRKLKRLRVETSPGAVLGEFRAPADE